MYRRPLGGRQRVFDREVGYNVTACVPRRIGVLCWRDAYTPCTCAPTMPKAYKVTSDPFFVNGNLTQSAIDTFTELEISMPLDSLNQEGIVVHAVYWTSSEPSSIPNASSKLNMQLTSTSQAGIVNANNANLISRRELVITGGAAEFSGPHVLDFIGSVSPYTEADNLMLVATDNVFLGVDSINQLATKTGFFRMVCSRIKLTSSAYAAMVTNELSS